MFFCTSGAQETVPRRWHVLTIVSCPYYALPRDVTGKKRLFFYLRICQYLRPNPEGQPWGRQMTASNWTLTHNKVPLYFTRWTSLNFPWTLIPFKLSHKCCWSVSIPSRATCGSLSQRTTSLRRLDAIDVFSFFRRIVIVVNIIFMNIYSTTISNCESHLVQDLLSLGSIWI